MTIFSLSPSVDVVEKDLTLIVPAVATSIGGFSGGASWGPVEQATVIDSENTLVSIFGEPDALNSRDFLTAADYLSYSNHLKFVRVVGDNATNSYSGGVVAPLIKNTVHYEDVISSYTDLKYVSKYPGTKGDSIRVSIADSASFGAWEFRSLFGSEITVNKQVSTTLDSDSVVLKAGNSVTGISVGMAVTGTGIPAGTTVLAITNSTTIKLSAEATATAATVSIAFTKFTGQPGTSAFVQSKSGSNDEVHVVVIDQGGQWTGTKGAVLERFQNVSKAFNAKDYSGASSYYVNVLNRTSRYVWFGGTHEETGWGSGAGTAFTSLALAKTYDLAGGVNDNDNITLANRIKGFEPFGKAEEIDVNLLVSPGIEVGDEWVTLTNYLIGIAESRKDCVAFISPPADAVIGNSGNELQSIVNYRGLVNSSSYGVMDSGWKYIYNQYADEYAWIPLSSSIAGLCANTDRVAEPWYSPAGLNRGFIKNVVKLAYNPGSKPERDTLYVDGINPVCVIPGEGVVLFGDKTMQSKPSAFDRINVRRLFIVLEKAIATAAKYQLFEFNDPFTRAQFLGTVEPYLRNVQGRRGITGFRAVCDESNNPPQVVDSNGFVGDIIVKPARSINNIQLNFSAVGTGVSFEEIVL